MHLPAYWACRVWLVFPSERHRRPVARVSRRHRAGERCARRAPSTAECRAGAGRGAPAARGGRRRLHPVQSALLCVGRGGGRCGCAQMERPAPQRTRRSEHRAGHKRSLVRRAAVGAVVPGWRATVRGASHPRERAPPPWLPLVHLPRELRAFDGAVACGAGARAAAASGRAQCEHGQQSDAGACVELP